MLGYITSNASPAALLVGLNWTDLTHKECRTGLPNGLVLRCKRYPCPVIAEDHIRALYVRDVGMGDVGKVSCERAIREGGPGWMYGASAN